jgi:hypothetical protein
MSGSFDGYHVWLGIPPSEQPPNHYRLLGIAVFEADQDVIDHAADRQMAHVRTFQAGKNGATSQQILNALAAARICLLNADKKKSYDEQLRAKLSAAPRAVPVAPMATIIKAAPVDASLLKAEPAAKHAGAGKLRGASTAAAPVYEPEEELDDLPKENFNLAEGLVSSGRIQLKPRRRRLIKLPPWVTSAGMGVTAGVIVAILLVVYYFRQYLAVPSDWQEFIIHGPATATEGELPSPTDAEGGATTTPPTAQ